jgi:hypothetical protein
VNLPTSKQIEELRMKNPSFKRRDYLELGPALYDCWLRTVVRYLEGREKRQATSVKLQAPSD